MDLNGGKPLSPWKVPSKISLKRIQHKINSDLTVPSHSSSSNLDKTNTKNNVKRNRFLANKFALSRSISTPTPDENLSQTSSTTTTDEHLLAKLQQIMPQQQTQQTYQMTSTMRSFSFEQTFSSQQTTNNKFPDEIVEKFPIDWSLKTSCRFYCSDNSPFLINYQKLRSQDESIAIEYVFSNGLKDNCKALFRSLTSYWIYPHISWLKLFPRSTNANNSNVASLDEQSQLTIQNEWKTSFQSLFQLFRTKSCSYFYFCANSFNILFREDEISQFVAIISPTTSGFRSTLEKEGIQFTIIDENDSTTNKIEQEQNDETENDDDENIDENDVTCAQWLEDMGLTNPSTNNSANEKQQFIKTKQKTFNENRSKTIVVKEISSVNSLFNYLLNKSERISLSLTGPLTGIPPTLISPSPFVNSTFKYLNVHFQSNSIVTIDGGPLLPSKIKDLWSLFTTEHHSIQMLCHHLEKTSAFNFDQQLFKTIKHISINQQQQLRVQFTSI